MRSFHLFIISSVTLLFYTAPMLRLETSQVLKDLIQVMSTANWIILFCQTTTRIYCVLVHPRLPIRFTPDVYTYMHSTDECKVLCKQYHPTLQVSRILLCGSDEEAVAMYYRSGFAFTNFLRSMSIVRCGNLCFRQCILTEHKGKYTVESQADK